MNISDFSASQLRQAADLKDEIEKLHEELASILGTSTPAATAPDGRRKKRKMSKAARALISAAQKSRWAKLKGATPSTPAKPKKKKFTMSASAKAAISKAAKARWAKIKAAQNK